MQDFSFLPLFYMVRARPPQSKAFNSRNNLRFICFCAPAHFRFPFFQNNFLCRVIHSFFLSTFFSLFRFAADTTNGPPFLPQSKEEEEKCFPALVVFICCVSHLGPLPMFGQPKCRHNTFLYTTCQAESASIRAGGFFNIAAYHTHHVSFGGGSGGMWHRV